MLYQLSYIPTQIHNALGASPHFAQAAISPAEVFIRCKVHWGWLPSSIPELSTGAKNVPVWVSVFYVHTSIKYWYVVSDADKSTSGSYFQMCCKVSYKMRKKTKEITFDTHGMVALHMLWHVSDNKIALFTHSKIRANLAICLSLM